MGTVGIVLLLVVIILLFGALPNWGPAPTGWHGYGWYPSSGLGLVVIILLVLLLMGLL